MKALICELLIACVLGAPGARTPDELAYGNLLYAYFQEDYTGALVEALVAERRGALGDDPARFTLAKGSLAFAEGLHRMSDAAFADLEPAALTEIDRMRLSFHRARAHYRDGHWSAMSAELDTIHFESGWFGADRQHPEVAFMRAEAALAANDFTAAQQILDALPKDTEYLGYGLFNLGVAERAAGNPAAAHAVFERLADLPLDGSAGRDLVARGRLAYAVTAREVADPVDAQAVLDRLPGTGRYRAQALAAYGDLAMTRADFTLAARIWLTLQEGGDWQEARAIAELGLPMALEGLDAPERALAAWHQAADRFEARLATLRALDETTAGTQWPGQLLQTYAVETPGKPGFAPPAIAETFGTEAWLAWLARDDINQLIGEWRDLQRMQRWLESLPDRLEALEEVKQERRRRSAAARTQLADQALGARRDEVLGRVETLERQLDELADPARKFDEDIVAALADPDEQALLDRLAGFSALLAGSAPATGTDRLAARIERLRGVVLWQIADSRSQRTRALGAEFAAARKLLTDIDLRIARVDRAEAELETGVEADFQVLAGRADALASTVALQLDERETALADAFRQAVEGEMQRVEQYLLTTRVAIARATDQLAATAAPQGPES